MPLRTEHVEAAPLTDDELATLALAADPDTPVDDDAVSLPELLGVGRAALLPAWYMPAPMAPVAPLRGWRRRVVLLVIASFLLITAYGLCNTYGDINLS